MRKLLSSRGSGSWPAAGTTAKQQLKTTEAQRHRGPHDRMRPARSTTQNFGGLMSGVPLRQPAAEGIDQEPSVQAGDDERDHPRSGTEQGSGRERSHFATVGGEQ